MLLGRSLRDVVILMVQAIAADRAGDPVRAQGRPARVAVVLGLLALIGLVVAPLSYAAALILKSEDAFAPLVQASRCRCCCCPGSCCRWRSRRTWLQTLSSLNPFTHAVDAARALFNGQWGDPEIAIGVGITAVLRRHLGLGRGPDVQPRQRVA